MSLKPVLEVTRWAIAIVVGYFLLRWAGAEINSAAGWRIDVAFEVAIAFAMYGLLLFALFGRSIIASIANRFAGVYWPDDSHFRIVPEYSVAEARANEGRYQEAVDEYRKVIAEHPDDIYPHLRIAELALAQFHDGKLAELELMSAFGKATGPDSTALAAGRLADLYQRVLQDPSRALAVMKQLRERIPDTKQAALAEERIAILEKLASGAAAPPPVPDKVAIRRSRYKMPE